MDTTSRGELLAQQTLGREIADIKAALSGVEVVLGITEELARSRQGQIGLLTAVNILARLGELAPCLVLDIPPCATVLPGIPLLAAQQPLGQALLELVRGLSHKSPAQNHRLDDQARRYDIGLFVGAPTADSRVAVTIGARGWLAAVRSDRAPEPVDVIDRNPLGIILAASLGAAEVVKHMWLPVRSSSVRIEPIVGRAVVSAFDWSVDRRDAGNVRLPERLALGHACVFGLGATGSACLFVLSCLNGAEMSLDLVDDDLIEPTNMERLFTAASARSSVGQFKAEHARMFLAGVQNGISAHAYARRFEQFVDRARDRLGYVFCCLDTGQARRGLQLELPSVVCNGGTDGARWTASFHEYDRPEQACLRDLYPPPGLQDFDAASDLAGRLGLEREQIKQWQASGAALDQEILAQAARRQGNPAQARAVMAYKGLTYNEAVVRVCSTMRPHQAAPAATIGFVAVQPAICMVSDLLKRRLYGWQPGPQDANLLQFDTLRHPATGKALRVMASRNCLCQTPRYRQACQTRQNLRAPHLLKMFTAAAPLPAAPARPIARRHDLVMERIAAIVAEAPPNIEQRHLPGPAPPGRERVPLRGWRGRLCASAAVAIAALALLINLALAAATTWRLAAFVSHLTAGRHWEPWRLISQAWIGGAQGAGFWACLVTSGLVLAAAVAAVLLIAPLMRIAVNLRRRPAPEFGRAPWGHAQVTLSVLSAAPWIALLAIGSVSMDSALLSSAWKGPGHMSSASCLGLPLLLLLLCVFVLLLGIWPVSLFVECLKKTERWIFR